MLVCLLKGIEPAQRVVPVRLQRVGDEAMVGIAVQKAAALELRAMAQLLKGVAAQSLRLIEPPANLVLDGKGALNGGRGHGLQQQRADRRLDLGCGNPATGLTAAGRAGLLPAAVV